MTHRIHFIIYLIFFFFALSQLSFLTGSLATGIIVIRTDWEMVQVLFPPLALFTQNKQLFPPCL